MAHIQHLAGLYSKYVARTLKHLSLFSLWSCGIDTEMTISPRKHNKQIAFRFFKWLTSEERCWGIGKMRVENKEPQRVSLTVFSAPCIDRVQSARSFLPLRLCGSACLVTTAFVFFRRDQKWLKWLEQSSLSRVAFLKLLMLCFVFFWYFQNRCTQWYMPCKRTPPFLNCKQTEQQRSPPPAPPPTHTDTHTDTHTHWHTHTLTTTTTTTTKKETNKKQQQQQQKASHPRPKMS